MPPPTTAEIDHGVPLFLNQLIPVLQSGGDRLDPSIGASAVLHGHDLRSQGLTVSQVVHDYGDICQSMTELAIENWMRRLIPTISGHSTDASTRSIAGAVTTFTSAKASTSDLDHAPSAATSVWPFSFITSEPMNTATVRVRDLPRAGGVSPATPARCSIGVSTGLLELIGRALDDVAPGAQNDAVIASTSPTSIHDVRRIRANCRRQAQGSRFAVTPIAPDMAVGDRQVLAAVVGNLLQNAFKFTRPCTAGHAAGWRPAPTGCSFRSRTSAAGCPEATPIQKACSGRSNSAASTAAASGIGLAFSRWGAEANGGRLYARNLRGNGCVFTVDLPRVTIAAMDTVSAGS